MLYKIGTLRRLSMRLATPQYAPPFAKNVHYNSKCDKIFVGDVK